MSYSLVKLAIMLSVAASAMLGASAQTLVLKNQGVIGTGCPSGATASLTNGTVTLNGLNPANFIASTGTGVSPSQNRKNCDATLTVDIPAGWQFGFGEASVPIQIQGATGVQPIIEGKYNFQGLLNDGVYTDTAIPEGVSATLTRVNSFAPSVWSSCGGADKIVVLNTGLRVNNANNKQSAASVKINGAVNTKIVWNRCTQV